VVKYRVLILCCICQVHSGKITVSRHDEIALLSSEHEGTVIWTSNLKIISLNIRFFNEIHLYVSSYKQDGSENYVQRRITIKSCSAVQGLDPWLFIAII